MPPLGGSCPVTSGDDVRIPHRFTRPRAGPGLLCAQEVREGGVCTGLRGSLGPLHVPTPRRAGHSVPWPPHPRAEVGFTFRSRGSLLFAVSAPQLSALGRRSVSASGARQRSQGQSSARNQTFRL